MLLLPKPAVQRASCCAMMRHGCTARAWQARQQLRADSERISRRAFKRLQSEDTTQNRTLGHLFCLSAGSESWLMTAAPDLLGDALCSHCVWRHCTAYLRVVSLT